MAKFEQGVLIVSGKVLDRNFPLNDLDRILTSVEEELRDRGVALTRRVVTLSGDHRFLASVFLNAGFETIPADNEDLQAAAAAFPLAFGNCPPDEIVFALGMDEEPVNFLRTFNGLTRRSFLVFDDPQHFGAISMSFARQVEHFMFASELIEKEGGDWAKLERYDFDAWVDFYMLGAEEGDEGTQRVGREAASQVEYEREGSDDRVLKLIGNIEPAEPTVEDVLNEDDKAAAVYAELVEHADEWKQELEHRVLDTLVLTCEATRLVEELDRHYNGLYNFFMFRRDEFKNLIAPRVFLIEEDEGVWTFYHCEHEEMRPVDATALTLGASAERTDTFVQEVGSSAKPESVNDTTRNSFAQIAKAARLYYDESRWMVERRAKSDAGAPHTEIKEQDAVMMSRARELGVTLWQAFVQFSSLSDDAFNEMADFYELFADALELMDRVERYRETLDSELVNKALQNLANVQCLVKSALNFYEVPLGNDAAQYRASVRMKGFRERFVTAFIFNMRLEDKIELSEYPTLRTAHDELAEKLSSLLDVSKKRDEYKKKLNYHLGLIRGNQSEPSLYDWGKVVECVTKLVKDCHEPCSSWLFRDLLKDLVDDVPEELDTTNEFGRVVQEIDDFNELERERANASFETEEEREPSANVLAVRERLNGGKVVFIGGTPKDHLRNRVEKAFGVSMIWMETSHGDSLDRFETYLNDPEVKLFLAYIPWCSHKHSEEFVSDYVKRWGKDSVRLRKGTNPEQMAVGILEQLKWTEAK